MSVTNLWLGRVTDTAAWARGKVTGASVRLAVSVNADLSSPTFFGPEVPTAEGVASVAATGLAPDTLYHYAFEDDATVDTSKQGMFRTAPVPGTAKSFRFWAGSCTGGATADAAPGATFATTNDAILDMVAAHGSDFGVHLGDRHYRNINANDLTAYRLANDEVIARAKMQSLHLTAPVHYLWSDHDFDSNVANKDSPSRPAVTTAYREVVPHHALPDALAIYQTWVWGRVRFIMLDTRTHREHTAAVDTDKTMLGTAQLTWLYATLDAATEPLIILLSDVPWVTPTYRSDNWSGYPDERDAIVAHIESENLSSRLLMLCGDMHAVAISTGRNNPHGGFPVAVLAAIHATPSYQTEDFGGYDIGCVAARRGFGVIDIEDDGELVTVYIEGRKGGDGGAADTTPDARVISYRYIANRSRLAIGAQTVERVYFGAAEADRLALGLNEMYVKELDLPVYDPVTALPWLAFWRAETLPEGPVALWPDEAGTNDLTQATTAARPSMAPDAAFGGEPVIVFDGVDDLMKSPIFSTLTQPYTFVMVLSATAATSSTGRLIGAETAAVGEGHSILMAIPSLLPRIRNVGGSTAAVFADASKPLSTPRIIVACNNGVSSYFRTNGTQTNATLTIGTSNLARVHLAADFSGINLSTMKVAMVGVLPTAPALQDVVDLEVWATTKFGLV